MLDIKLNNNIDKVINIAKRRKNHTLIALSCLAVTVLNMISYTKDPIGGKEVPMFPLSITTYAVYVAICLVLSTFIDRMFYPSRIKITADSVVLFMGFITLQIKECTISIEQNVSAMMTESLKNHFVIETPNIFTVRNKDKSMSFVIDSSELDKINKS